MVRHRHGQNTAQKKEKGKHVAVAGPRLARGRTENLIRSASCTPSDDEGSPMDEDESTAPEMESSTLQDSLVPEAGRVSSTVSFSPAALTPSSISRVAYSSGMRPLGSLDGERHVEWYTSPSVESTDGDSNHNAVLAGLVGATQSSASYPLRLSEIPHSPVSTVQSPTSTIASSTTIPGVSASVRRISESGYRPILQRPPRDHETFVDSPAQDADRHGIGKAKGVKKAYKSKEERDKVKAVRHVGACIRCSIMRQACEVTEEGKPCKNCEVTRRKFNIPCTRDGPATRWTYLFPELVMSRHDPANLRVHYGQIKPRSFRIPLTHISGFAIELCVVEESDLPDTDLQQILFVEGGERYALVAKTLQDKAPPLVPVITTNLYDVASWIARQITANTGGLFIGLPGKVFPEQKGQDWPRTVLFLFQEYHQRVYQSPLILKIFRTLLVRHLMSKPFFIPLSQMRTVNAKLSKEFRESDEEIEIRERNERIMVPKIVNKYLKAALVQLLREKLKSDFADLERLFKIHEKSPGKEITDLDRDVALCFVTVLLMIVAITQIKIMEVATSRDRDASQNCPLGPQTQSVQQAKELIATIETEVVDHILDFFSYKFVRSHRRGTLEPGLEGMGQQAMQFNLVERFMQTRRNHEHLLVGHTDPILNLSDESIPRFMLHNPTRILLRVANCLNPSKSRR